MKGINPKYLGVSVSIIHERREKNPLKKKEHRH